jgi:hypothetical protein
VMPAQHAGMELLQPEHEHRAAYQRARDEQAEEEFFGPVHNRARLVYLGPTPPIRRLVLCHLLDDVGWRIITPRCCTNVTDPPSLHYTLRGHDLRNAEYTRYLPVTPCGHRPDHRDVSLTASTTSTPTIPRPPCCLKQHG